MSTRFIRFPDEAAFRAACAPSTECCGETVDPLPEGVQALSVVGPIYQGGQEDEAGNVVVPPTRIPGWHVNVLGEVPAAWADFEVHPTTPSRVFGGDPT
jgi:hypothetical protein